MLVHITIDICHLKQSKGNNFKIYNCFKKRYVIVEIGEVMYGTIPLAIATPYKKFSWYGIYQVCILKLTVTYL